MAHHASVGATENIIKQYSSLDNSDMSEDCIKYEVYKNN